MKEMMLQCPRCQWWNTNSLLKYEMQPAEPVYKIPFGSDARSFGNCKYHMLWRCYHCFVIIGMKATILKWVECAISKIFTPNWKQEMFKFMEEHNDTERSDRRKTSGRLLTKVERSNK